MKIKHLFLLPIIGYLIYIMYHAFTISFSLKGDELTTFDIFANIFTSITTITFILMSPFIYLKFIKNSIIIKRINKFLNHKIL